MDKKIIKKATKDKENKRKCGTITCIHCVRNTCSIDKCDFYERNYMQEH